MALFSTWPADDLTGGAIDVPAIGGAFRQQYSPLGLPLTRGAWKDQAALDEGRLWARVSRAFELSAPAEAEACLHQPSTFARQAEVVRAELEAADRDPRGALLLELLPTETNSEASLRALGDTLLDGLTGLGSNDFRVSREVALIRDYHAHLTAPLRASGRRVRALVLPYANTVENILARKALPLDGAETLRRYLGKLSSKTFTVALGYSQGATAVRLALKRGPRPSVAMLLAPMGGVNLDGAHGVFAGTLHGARALIVSNAHDPALWVRGDSWAELLPGLLNFSNPNKPLGGRVGIHGGYYGDDSNPLDRVAVRGVALDGLSPEQAAWRLRRFCMDAGTFGYPTAYMRALAERFFGQPPEGALRRRGDWAVDLREELREDGQLGRALDLKSLRRAAEDVAAQALG